MSVKDRIVKILLIEDNKDHQMEVRRVLDQQRILYQMWNAGSVEAAMSFLENENNDDFVSLDIVLLDIDMQKSNCTEFLTQFLKNRKWSRIKIFVLSDSERERQNMAKIGVSGYIIKPLRLRSPSRDTISLLVDLMNICERP